METLGDTIDEAPEPATANTGTRAARIRARLFGGDEPLTRVDRFRLERKLGAGGMGTVYEAWDEELQRRVALKFLSGSADTPSGQRRFFREAQGLARLSHPNVVPVYDVGRWRDRVWIAMEYIPGRTLGAWAAATPRSQAEIVRHWIAAGRGLAAIHAAGLIHRDIKPNNVLLGDDGRVRIVDFGLVKAADTLDMHSESSGARTLDQSSSSSSQLSDSLTKVDSFVGTPAYAAPEHQDGRWVDARSDQFSLCVALWEALCGARPPRQERERGGLVPLPPGVRIPKRLHRALSRGLALEPCDRFADVPGLLAALEPPRRRWLAPSVAAGVTALVAGTAALVFPPTPEMAAPAPCAEATAPVDELWTPRRRQAINRQLEPAIAAQAQQLIDEWTLDWSEAATSSCEDVHVHRLYSERALDRRAICLARSLHGLDAFLFAIEDGHATTAQAVTEWLGALPDPEACLGEAILRTNYEATAPEHADEVAALHRQLISATVGYERDYGRRLEAVEAVRERARALGDRALLGEAALGLGILHAKRHDIEAARIEIGRAIDIGTAMADVELTAEAWSTLFRIDVSITLDKQRAHWAWTRQAALFDEIEPSPRRRARIQHDYARYLILDSRLAEAEASIREALATYERVGPAAAWDQATALRTLAWALSLLGRDDEALAAHRAARELELGSPGRLSRNVSSAAALLDEGIALVGADEPGEARAKLTAGLDEAIAQQGPRGPLVARFHVVLAAACDQLGDRDCLRAHSEQADAISLVALGPTHLLRVDVLSTVGVVALQDERHEAAVAAFEQALSIARRHLGPESLQVGLAQRNLAHALHVLGHDERAKALAGRTLELLETKLGPDHAELLPLLLLLAEIEIERDAPTAARALLDRATDIAPDTDTKSRDSIDQLLVRAGG